MHILNLIKNRRWKILGLLSSDFLYCFSFTVIWFLMLCLLTKLKEATPEQRWYLNFWSLISFNIFIYSLACREPAMWRQDRLHRRLTCAITGHWPPHILFRSDRGTETSSSAKWPRPHTTIPSGALLGTWGTTAPSSPPPLQHHHTAL